MLRRIQEALSQDKEILASNSLSVEKGPFREVGDHDMKPSRPNSSHQNRGFDPERIQQGSAKDLGKSNIAQPGA